MSGRSALARGLRLVRPDYPRRDPVGGRAARAEFRFSVPVLRAHDVDATAAWYRRHLGFRVELFPDHSPREFAVLERDGVQLLVRRAEPGSRVSDRHAGWDLYIWVNGADFERLEASAGTALVGPRRAMGNLATELELRDPDGHVLCVGGPSRALMRS